MARRRYRASLALPQTPKVRKQSSPGQSEAPLWFWRNAPDSALQGRNKSGCHVVSPLQGSASAVPRNPGRRCALPWAVLFAHLRCSGGARGATAQGFVDSWVQSQGLWPFANLFDTPVWVLAAAVFSRPPKCATAFLLRPSNVFRPNVIWEFVKSAV